MSKTTKRETPAPAGGSVDDRLARLLDTPFLARLVPHLPPEALHSLIRSQGLEACTELVTSATPAQLTSLLDLDLWHQARPGRDDRFDVDRFGEWLEVLVDAGPSAAARTVAALDKDLVIVGLCRYVRVFDPGIFEPIAQSDDEPIDRHEAMREGDSLDGGTDDDPIEREVAGYVVRARRPDAWDAIVTLLIALDAEHGSYFHAVMRGCLRLSNSRPEIDGLDDLLREPEQRLHDVAVERERRRSQLGYATPADARAFLQMARQPQPARSAIVTAYFRAADEIAESSTGETEQSSDVPAPASDAPESLEAVIELLTEAGVMPERPRALLAGAPDDPEAARLTLLRRLMAHVLNTDETAYLTRSRELAFLANTLVAGCSVQSRPLTPQEASGAAAGICNLGLEYGDAPPPDAWLVDHDLVTAFEAGWAVLYRDVSLFVANELIATLKALDCVDRDTRRELTALRRALEQQRKAGTPWRARDAAEILATLDQTAWISVLGLLDECPVVPAALTAILEGRTTAVSPTAFEFISTAAQIDDVRTFMRKLPDLLSR